MGFIPDVPSVYPFPSQEASSVGLFLTVGGGSRRHDTKGTIATAAKNKHTVNPSHFFSIFTALHRLRPPLSHRESKSLSSSGEPRRDVCRRPSLTPSLDAWLLQ